MHGWDVIRYWYKNVTPGLSQAGLEHLPEVLAKTDIEAFAFDTTYRLELVPIHLRIPYAQIWNVHHMDFTGSTPASLFDWPYDPTPEGRVRNMEGLRKIKEVSADMRAVAISYADKVGLEIDWTDPTATSSKLAIISQTPREFDFPGIPWPSQFHYAGPFHDDEGRKPVPFPWEKLTGKYLIYASLGTLVNEGDNVYQIILQAVANLPGVQMVLSIGHNVDPNYLGTIPSNTIVVPVAPQIELLKRAELCITHAGLNTTLESLAHGVPMIAIPHAFDQPGIAARIAYHGVGESLNLGCLTAEALSELIQKVRRNSGYKTKADYFRALIARTRGLDVAADVLEEAFRKALS